MSILRCDKMRPLFQEAIVTKLAVTHKVPDDSYGYYLSNDTPWVSVGHVVQTPQSCKVGHISKINWNAKKCTFFTSTKKTFFGTLFSKKLSFKDFFMKTTPNSHRWQRHIPVQTNKAVLRATNLTFLEAWKCHVKEENLTCRHNHLVESVGMKQR